MDVRVADLARRGIIWTVHLNTGRILMVVSTVPERMEVAAFPAQ